MKTKKVNKKLSLNKTTIAALDNQEQQGAKGGYLPTVLWGGCYTWHPICPTRYESVCPCTTNETIIREFCYIEPVTDFDIIK